MTAMSYDVRVHLDWMLQHIDNMWLCGVYLVSFGIPEPKAKTEYGLKARLLCPKWWRRTLDRMKARSVEADQIESGKVHSRASKYASDYAVIKTAKRQSDNQKFIGEQSLISDADDVVEMADIVRGSLSNPTNRRAELMIRMAGFEAYAMTHGYVGEFYTLTCPSKYHRYAKAQFNATYTAESTPKAAQKYLCGVWAKIRAQMARQEIRVFGFRVAEPHHDGCPHWHMLLFVESEHVESLRGIISHYALEMDGDEPGAKRYRFKAVQIDPNQGTATGYIAKYISKNLGFSIDAETLGDPAQTDYGLRVKAWASVWGIRQFQQIGGVPVLIWRELRKLSDEQQDEIIEGARLAADQSRWADFLEIMGGAVVRRDDLAIKLKKADMVNHGTGELKQNAYGELVPMVIGLFTVLSDVRTKLKNWVLVPTKELVFLASQPSERALGARAGCVSWSPVNNCTA